MDHLTNQVRIIWETILNTKDNLDFFSSGGDSIKLLQLVGSIEEVYGEQIDLDEIFDNFTIETVAKQLIFCDLKVREEKIKDHVSKLIELTELHL